MKLFDLAGDHERVLRIYCEIATRYALDEKAEEKNKHLMEYGDQFVNRLNGGIVTAQPKTVATFHTVRGINNFFRHYFKKNYELALEEMQKLRIIPSSNEEINEKIAKFKNEDLVVVRFIPEILIAFMNTLYKIHERLREESRGFAGDISKRDNTEYISGIARVLISYAARIPVHLPGDTNSRLLQMQAAMN